MSPQSERATVAVVHSELATAPYCRVSWRAGIILAALIFSLHSPNLTDPERQTVLSFIADLIRLKIDAGLLKGVRHGG